MRALLFGVIATLFSAATYAQLDTKHYIPPLHARADDASGSGEDIYLVISTPQTVPFDVTITDGAGNLLFAPVSVSRSAPASLALSSATGATKGTGTKFLVTAAQLATVLSDEGLILTANKAFFASIRVDESAQAESITSKGTAGLGTEFRSGHIWNTDGASNLKSHVISFMATEDNTTVTVSDFGGVDFENVNEGSGSIFVTLDAGQSYVLAAYCDVDPDNLNDVNGTRITSDKPIAVNSGSWLAGSPGGTLQGRDIGVDQIAPIEETGFEYILIKGEGAQSENVIAVAGMDGTNLYINGSATPINSTPLNAGDYYRLTVSEYTTNENMYIRSNQPVYIYQGLNGVADTNERQFGLNYVPPIVCLGGTNVDLPDIDQLGTPVIQIIGETGAPVTITNQSGITTDISASAKAVSGRPEYVTYKVTGYTGDVTVESPRPIRVALTFASGNVGAAGFFSGFTTAPVVESPDGYGTTTCIPDDLPITLTASGFDDFQWYRDGIELTGETSSSLTVTSPGLYTAAGKIAGCMPSVQSFPVTISLCPGDIGGALNAVSVNNVSGSIFDVVFDLIITNYSSTNTVPNLQLVDDITDGLPAGATASLQIPPSIISGSFLTGGINPAYDGVSNIAMLQTSATTVDTELDVASSVTIRFTVRIDMSGATSPAYNNQAVVTSTITGPNDGITVTFDKQDFSDAGTNPDPDGDGDPTETGENDVTMVCVDNTTIAYDTETYYTTGTDPTPTITGLTGGTFSAGSGLSIDATTGTVDLSESFVGSYVVTYSFGGSCPTTTPITIELNPPDEPTVVPLETNSTTPTITGSASLEVGEVLTVTVNGVTYTEGDGNLSLSGTTWMLTIPAGNAITTDGTYEVTATITNGPLSTDDLTSNELVIDTDPPSVDIQGEPAIADNGVAFTVTFQFDEDVVGFGITDVVISNGTSSSFATVDANTYTLNITPNGLGDVTIDVNAGAAKDAAGNNNTAATQAVVPLEIEAVYTVNAARNVDTYANNDVLATVTDANGVITSAVVASGSLPSGVTLNATTGAISVSDATQLPAGSTSFDITTTDALGGTTTQTVTITITADNEAVYTVNAALNVDSYSNSDVLATVADPDGAIAAAVVSSGTLPPGTALNPTTGTITVSDATSLVAGTVNFDVTTTDEDGGKTTQTVAIQFIADNEAVYAVAPAQNIDSYADTDVLATVTDADGNIVSATIVNGSLPAGTAINATTGTITVSDATLLVAATTNVDVETVDEDGGVTVQTVSITFIADNEAVYVINPARNVDSYADNDVLATVTDADGDIVSATIVSGSLPAGTSIDATTGAITVNDADLLVAATTNIDVTTEDEDGGITTQTVSITFIADNEAVYVTNPARNVDSYANNDVLAMVTDADGAIVSATIVSGSLPAGTTINTTTGEITVSDASLLVAATTNVDVATEDEDGGVTTHTVSITFIADNEAVYTVNSARNVDSYADSDVLATATDADGAIVSATVVSGSLPAGTTINTTTGAIAVSDADLLVAATTNFDVATEDEDGGITVQTVSITFIADNESVYVINPARNVDSYANSDVLATVTDADGNIVSASIVSGTLPVGTAINPTTGAVTVIDADLLVAATTTVDVSTEDEDGGITVQTIAISFIADNEAVYSVNPARNVDSYVDSDVLATVTDADGAIVSATVVTGSLPAGTTISPTTGAITVSDADLLVATTTNIDVATQDDDGGVTVQTVSITFIADNEAVYSVNAARNVDSYADNDVLATVTDADGAIVSAAVVSGTLPAGVTINATTGAITVADADLLVAATTNFDVETQDEDGGITVQTVSITLIADIESVYVINPARNVDSYEDSDVLATVADPDGNIVSATIASGTLPAGTAIDPTTGTITVVDANLLVATTTIVDVSTEDEDGGVTVQTIALNFIADNESAYAINPARNVDSYADNDVLATVSDSDGAIISAAIVSGSLPAGTTINTTTGAITVSDSDLLVAGTTNFDVATEDADGGATVQTVSITFIADNEAGYVINPARNVDSYADNDVLATVTDADGALVSATIVSGSLPAGTTINATTGAISVSDADLLVAASTNIDVATEDEDGGITIQTVSLTFIADNESVYSVNPARNIDSYADNDVLATVTDADGALVSATIISGSLPAGTTINSTTGAITVIDEDLLVASTTNVDVATEDEDGGITVQTISIIFIADNESVYVINPARNVDSYADNDVLATVTDADGAIVSASIVTGTLPPGTAINPTTGAISVIDADLLAASTTVVDVSTEDEDGGVTVQTIAINFIADNEAVYSTNPAHNVDSYNDSDVLATVTDTDGAIVSATVVGGSLPSGTTIDATTGTITVSDADLLVAATTNVDIATADEDGGVTVQTVSISFITDNEAVYSVSPARNVDTYLDNDVLATVTDADGDIVSATITSGSLPAGTAINTTTGAITVSDANLLVAATTNIDVATEDEGDGLTVQTVTITFITDSEAAYSINPARNVDSYADNDVLATVTDADGAIVSATIVSGTLPVGTVIYATTGTITVADADLLVAATTSVDVATTDEDGGITIHAVTISILGDAEAMYTTNPARNVDSYAAGDILAFVSDTDGEIVSAVVSSGTLPTGVTINAATGAITVQNASLLTAGTTAFDVTTTDENGGTTVETVSLTFVSDTEAVFDIMPAENVDSYINGGSLVTVTDADGGVVSAIIESGTLPAGTSLNTSTGTVTVSDASLLVAGTRTFVVRTTDATGGQTSQLITLVFTQDNESQYDVTPPRNIDAYGNGDVLAAVTDADGGLSSAVLTAGSLPQGTSLDAVTGEITVTDVALIQEGSFDIQVTTTDATGGVSVHDLTITFGNDHEAIYTVADPQPLQEYTNGMMLGSVSDEDGSIASAAITSGSLPPGTTLDPVTGAISVTDATAIEPGSYSLEVTTTDSGGGTTSHSITIEVLESTLDSDGDGVLDIVEDLNQDGDPSNEDTDNDGIANYLDTDDDGDGILTQDEDINNNGDPVDDNTDGDATPNYLDTDDDNDNIPTADEDDNDNGDPTDDDCDGDGVANYLDNELCEVVPEKGFSPNGDGISDTWVIHGIEHYPSNSVKVYNRWGNLVFEAEGYNNNNISWDGQGNGKLQFGGRGVPDGTYFYFIQVDAEKKLSGYVIIKR
jgi:gliding motility-associated-like protein